MMGQLFCLSYSIFLAVPCVMARAYANTILLPLFCIGNQACKVRNDFWAATSKCKHVLYALIEHSHTNFTQHSHTRRVVTKLREKMKTLFTVRVLYKQYDTLVFINYTVYC